MKILRILGKKGRITIPYEIRQRVGFRYNDVLSFSETPDGRTITIKREKLCGCDKNGNTEQKKNNEVTLFEFLNSLSDEQQRAALVHLSLKYAVELPQKNISEV